MGCNPNYDRAKSILPVLAIGKESSCLEGRVVNLQTFQQLINQRSNSMPDSIELSVKDPMSSLARNMWVSAYGHGEGIFK